MKKSLLMIALCALCGAAVAAPTLAPKHLAVTQANASTKYSYDLNAKYPPTTETIRDEVGENSVTIHQDGIYMGPSTNNQADGAITVIKTTSNTIKKYKVGPNGTLVLSLYNPGDTITFTLADQSEPASGSFTIN